MPTNIISVTDIGSDATQAITLNNSRIVRKHGLAAADWDVIRFGIRYSGVNPSDAAYDGTPRFYMGFCNGDTVATDPPPSGTAPHALYFRSDDSTFATSTASNYHRLFPQDSSSHMQKSVNGTESAIVASAGNAWSIPNWSGTWDKDTTLMLFQLEKTTKSGDYGTAWTVRWGGYYNPMTQHYTRSELVKELEIETFTSTNADSKTNATSVAADESVDGEFDSVFLGWNKAGATIQVHDMMVSIITAP